MIKAAATALDSGIDFVGVGQPTTFLAVAPAAAAYPTPAAHQD